MRTTGLHVQGQTFLSPLGRRSRPSLPPLARHPRGSSRLSEPRGDVRRLPPERIPTGFCDVISPWMAALVLLALPALGCGDLGGGGSKGVPERRLLVVTTEPLLEAAEDYAAYRASRGIRVSVITTQEVLDQGGGGPLAEALKDEVASWAATGSGGSHRYLLIIADANVGSPEDPLFVPVNAGQGGFVGDHAYGDLDGDGVPDLAIGRLPFREPAAVQAYLDRVRGYEEDRPIGPFNRRVSAFAGEGGFGPQIDAALEWAALRIFEALSYDFDVSMAYAASSSPYYLPASAWDADYVAKYNAGAVLQPYIGHTLGGVDQASLQAPARPGLLAFLSCSDGEFQLARGPVTSLGEELLLLPVGPLGVLAASDWSHPYGNALVSLELTLALLNEREPTYGRALQIAKQRMVYPEGELREELDIFAAPFIDEPAPHLARTHVVLYNLLGDPTLEPGFPPGKVTFHGPERGVMGQSITVTGSVTTNGKGSPMASGEILVTLECERGAILGTLVPVEGTPTLAEALENHAIANDKVLLEARVPVSAGAFSVTFDLPASIKQVGYYLKGYAWNATTDAMGSRALPIYR